MASFLYNIFVNNIMVIDNKELKPLHELTEEGKRNYQKFLEDRADEIIYKSEHPFKYFFGKILDFFA